MSGMEIAVTFQHNFRILDKLFAQSAPDTFILVEFI